MLSSFAEAQRKAGARARSSGKGGKKRQSGPAEQLDWVKRFKAAEQNDSVAKKAAATTQRKSTGASTGGIFEKNKISGEKFFSECAPNQVQWARWRLGGH